MSIYKIHLNKLLRLLYLPEKELKRRLNIEVNQDIKRIANELSSGGNFYEPFWHDVKLHVSDNQDLNISTANRINSNKNRRNLYPQLKNGFLELWKRGSNQNVVLIDKSPKGRFFHEDLNLTIKVENILGIKLNEQERLGYPYWFPDPILDEEAARLGLWVIEQALYKQQIQNVRILDVIRANFFSLENCPLKGNEEKILVTKFKELSRRYENIKQQKERGYE